MPVLPDVGSSRMRSGVSWPERSATTTGLGPGDASTDFLPPTWGRRTAGICTLTGMVDDDTTRPPLLGTRVGARIGAGLRGEMDAVVGGVLEPPARTIRHFGRVLGQRHPSPRQPGSHLGQRRLVGELDGEVAQACGIDRRGRRTLAPPGTEAQMGVGAAAGAECRPPPVGDPPSRDT